MLGALGLLASVVAFTGVPGAQAQVTGPGGTWERTDPLNVARYDHTTTLLPSGKVLAAAGRSLDVVPPQTFASAELYDPITEQWDLTGSLTTPRFDHTATLLPDGKVLVAGGFGPAALTTAAQPVQATAELYDPATGTWTPTGSLNVRRALHAAALLADGRVLVAGGRTCDQPPPAACTASFRTATAEIYNPATGTWTPTGSMNADRHTTAAVRLLDGRVLVPAGFTATTPSGSNTGDVYDPATGTWSLTGNLNRGRSRQGAMLLHDGRAMVALGFSGPGVPNPTTELYNPATNSWALADNIDFNFARFNFHYVVMPNGKPVVAGGQFFTFSQQGIVRDSHIYDPATNDWINTSPLNDPHGSGSSLSNSMPMVVLSGSPTSYVADPTKCGRHCGKALLAGQHPGGSTELFTPAGTCFGFNATITGTDNAEDIAGTPGPDVILALGGNDRIAALGGDDIICGGAGDDQIAAGAGLDVVLGGEGLDRVTGDDGDDFMFGEAGPDQTSGGNGTDTSDGGADADSCRTEIVRSCP